MPYVITDCFKRLKYWALEENVRASNTLGRAKSPAQL